MVIARGLVLSVLLSLTLIGKQTSAQINVTDIINSNGLFFNGTCPDLKRTPENSLPPTFGYFYLQFLNPGILFRGKKCAISIMSIENGTVYVTQYQTDIR
jgi:hypothetical protein